MVRRIRVVIDPPVDVRHNVRKNGVYEVLAIKPRTDTHPPGYWVMGEMGRPVLVMNYEACEYPEGWG
jgi:hypothetical protein